MPPLLKIRLQEFYYELEVLLADLEKYGTLYPYERVYVFYRARELLVEHRQLVNELKAAQAKACSRP